MNNIHRIKSTMTLAIPLMGAFLAQKGMQFIDTLMMGWLGPDALAAGAIALSIFMTTLVFSMGTSSAVGIFIVRAKGANNLKEIKINLQHGICLAFLLSPPCMLIIWYAPHFLSMIIQNSKVVANATLLLHGLTWGLPGYLLFLIFREFVSAFSLTRIVMLVTLGSLPLTFVANYVLIYGKYGFPQLGIAGIGYGGAFVLWFMFLCMLIFCIKTPLLKEYVSFKLFKFDRHKIIDMLSIGIPSGMLSVFESGMFLTTTIMMGYFGVNALAAFQITMQFVNIVYAIPFALSIATALQIGHTAGAKNLVQAKPIIFLNLSLVLVASSIVALIFVLFPEVCVNIFLSPDDANYNQISRLAISFIIIAGIFQAFDALQSLANGALRGLKDTLIPMIFSLGCYWFLGVGSAYFFAFHTHLESKGIWYGLTLGMSSVAIVLLLRFFKRLEKELSTPCYPLAE